MGLCAARRTCEAAEANGEPSPGKPCLFGRRCLESKCEFAHLKGVRLLCPGPPTRLRRIAHRPYNASGSLLPRAGPHSRRVQQPLSPAWAAQ